MENIPESEKTKAKGTLIHDGKYIQYNVLGNIFEVTSNYIPPLQPVGRGAYGIVCCATNADTNEGVAIKKIGDAFDNRIDAKRTLREIKLLCHMDHDNVIKIKDIIKPADKEKFNDVYIVYELMDTDLHQIIQSNQALTDEHCQILNWNKKSNVCARAIGKERQEEYTAAIDVWSVGCILMEILRREPLFPGKDYVQQLSLITEMLGSPNEEDLGFLRSDNAKKYVKQLPHVDKQPFAQRFPDISPLAIDLAEKMLVFDPSKRITVEEALNHPYMSSLHEINEEPVCPSPFVFDFEQATLNEEDIKELIWKESLNFCQEKTPE
ncbi:hypothetical protein TSUD_96880 [Trifolium subterraneum]|nr:hypothetical protein TSUD_96880 [Trifolium subterraneum]